MQLQQHFT